MRYAKWPIYALTNTTLYSSLVQLLSHIPKTGQNIEEACKAKSAAQTYLPRFIHARLWEEAASGETLIHEKRLLISLTLCCFIALILLPSSLHIFASFISTAQ